MNQELELNYRSSNEASSNLNHKAETKVLSANSLKLEGNVFFKENNFKEAIRRYHKALLYIKGVENDGSDMLNNISSPFMGNNDANRTNKEKIKPALLEKNRQLKLECYNNLSACLLKTAKPDFEKVVFYCQEVIKVIPDNPKAHFRMAQALYKLGKFEEALRSCNCSLENQHKPDSKVTNLKTRCVSELAKQTSNQKDLYSRMLGFK